MKSTDPGPQLTELRSSRKYVAVTIASWYAEQCGYRAKHLRAAVLKCRVSSTILSLSLKHLCSAPSTLLVISSGHLEAFLQNLNGMNHVSTGREFGPVYELPPEILDEIFVQCLPAFPTLSHEVAPLLLCSVCSSWRNVALHSSRLWSRISINMSDLVSKGSSEPDGEEAVFPAIQFLERSKNRPLSIQMTASSPALFDHPDWKFRLDLFLDQFHNRIQDLDLSSSWLSHLLYSISTDKTFPQLSSVAVASSNGPSFDSLPTPFTAFSSSGFLKRFTYKACISHETVLNIVVPWGQLTHITLTDVDYASWNYIFLRCTNLRSGTFVVSGTPQPSPKSPPEISFPSLTHLSIHSIQTSRSPLSLKGYGFPNLKKLKLGWNHSPGFDTSFLSSINNLEYLAISSPQCHFINFGEVLSILSLTPSISELHVSNDHCNSELFEALTYHAHQQRPLLPQLRALAVETSHWNSMCGEAPILTFLEKMVGSRWWTFPNSKVERLEVLRMSTAKQNLDGVNQALETLTTAGLSLQLRTSVPGDDDDEILRHNRN